MLVLLPDLPLQHTIATPDSITINVATLQPPLDLVLLFRYTFAIIQELESFTRMQDSSIVKNDAFTFIELTLVAKLG